MSTGLRHTTIETFRKRQHGGSVLRLYKLNANGETISLIRELTKGFFLSVSPDTTEGAIPFVLTIDMPFSPSLTVSELAATHMVILYNASTAESKRYRIDTETVPQTGDSRYVFGVHAAYNDAKAIV